MGVCRRGYVLTGLAMLAVLALHPGGFETQGAWLLVLLPASLAAYPISDYVHKPAPHAEPVVFGRRWRASTSFATGSLVTS